MGTGARLFYTNLIIDNPAALTASSEDAIYPVANIAEDNYSQVWRSTDAGASAQTIVADFGAAVSISAVALGNINVRNTATVKIQGHTADSWATPDVDETIDVSQIENYRRNLYHELASTYSKRYWRISILDNGNPDGFIELGEWFLGVHVELSQTHDGGFPRRLIRNNVEHRTEYNQAFVYSRDWGWQVDLSWNNADETTRDQLRLLHQVLGGNATPFFYVLDPTVPAEALYCRISNEFEEMRIHYDFYSMRLQIMEEIPGLIVPR